MELRTLRYFLEVAREQSMSRAAERLYVTQPTISRQLAELAIRSGAPRVVLCHNHPHGREAFSDADIQTTRAAVGYLRAMDIELSDHLLVTGGAVISMRRSGPAGRLVFDDRA